MRNIKNWPRLNDNTNGIPQRKEVWGKPTSTGEQDNANIAGLYELTKKTGKLSQNGQETVIVNIRKKI